MAMEKSLQQRQEQLWSGAFGRAYTERNAIEVHPGRVRFFREHVLPLRPRSILEVGCGAGLNLRALEQTISGPAPLIVGVDPEPVALAKLQVAATSARVARASVFGLPFSDRGFDLVMTVAVLIHMSPENLPRALEEIYRISNRYILTHEYYAEEETDILWHGRAGVLFKRDFLAHWQRRYPDLRLVDSGFLTEDEGFDRMTFWVLEKRS